LRGGGGGGGDDDVDVDGRKRDSDMPRSAYAAAAAAAAAALLRDDDLDSELPQDLQIRKSGDDDGVVPTIELPAEFSNRLRSLSFVMNARPSTAGVAAVATASLSALTFVVEESEADVVAADHHHHNDVPRARGASPREVAPVVKPVVSRKRRTLLVLLKTGCCDAGAQSTSSE